MAFHRFSENVKAVNSFASGLTSGTQNGSSVDTVANPSPFRRAALLIDMATGAGTTANFQLQDSPDNATWTNVTNGTLGTPVAASTQWTQLVDIDLSKRQRYLRVQLIGTGTTGAATADFLLFEGEYGAPTQVNPAISL